MSDPKPKPQTEEEWEAEVLEEVLGDALHPDGRIDFDKLRARSEPVLLEEIFDDDEPHPLESKWLLNVQPDAQFGLSHENAESVYLHLRELLKVDDPNKLPFYRSGQS